MKKIKYMLLLLALMSGVINITFAEEASTGFKLPEQDIQRVTNGYNETASQLASKFPEGR